MDIKYPGSPSNDVLEQLESKYTFSTSWVSARFV